MSIDEDKVNISLVIDDDNTTHVEINLNNLEAIEEISDNICEKYHLNLLVKRRLKKELIKEMEYFKEKIAERKRKRDDNIKRLYYDSVEKNKKKSEYLEKMKNDKSDNLLRQYTFTPSVSKKSNELYKRDFYKIEDKLYSEHKKLKEKKNYQKLLIDISKRGGNKLNLSTRSNPNKKEGKKKERSLTRNKSNTFIVKNIDQSDSQDQLLQTPIFNFRIIDPKLENKETNNPSTYSNNANNNNPFFSTDASLTLKKDFSNLQKKLSFNKTSNSYTEKYLSQNEKAYINALSNVNQVVTNNNSQSNDLTVRQTPFMTQTPTPKHTEGIKNKFSLGIKTSTSCKETPKLFSNKIVEEIESPRMTLKDDKNLRQNLSPKFSRTFANFNNDNVNNPNISESKKQTSDNRINRLYKYREDYKKKREDMVKKQIDKVCPFKPKINKQSNEIMMKTRNESKDEFINRLTTSKKIQSIYSTVSNHNISNSLTTSKSRSKSTRLFTTIGTATKDKLDSSRIKSTTKLLGNTHLCTDSNTSRRLNTKKNENLQSECSTHDKTRIRDVMSDRSLYGKLHTLKNNKNEANNVYKQKYNQDINKVKMNNLKNLFEIISNKCSDIEDLQKINDEDGVSNHIKEKLIIPTCNIIRNRDLDFTFQNFYLIANEILNNFF